MAVENTVFHPDGPFKPCSCTIDVHDLLLTYSIVSILLRDDLLCLSLAVSIASQANTSGIAAVIKLLTTIYDPSFDAQLFTIQVKSIVGHRKISDRKVKKQKQ